MLVAAVAGHYHLLLVVAVAAADLFLLVAVVADADHHHLKLVAAVAASDADHYMYYLQLVAAAGRTLVAVGHHYLSLVVDAAAADLSPLVAVVYHPPLIAAAVATLWARSGVCTPWPLH